MTLDEIFNQYGADKGSIGHGFSEWYQPLFEPLREKPIRLLECGIQFGCSTRAWLHYFPNGEIYGVDCGNEHKISDSRFHFEIGNQRDVEFWKNWKLRNPTLDIIIDDAEHRADASMLMFSALWSHLLPGGVYAIEDTCCWWDDYFSSPQSGGEFAKSLVANVNLHGKEYGGKPYPTKNVVLTPTEATIKSIHFSRHLCILTKKS
jgi:hypothetical protein